MFQSTHPRRVWQNIKASLSSLTSFNPHTHEGCDTNYVYKLSNWVVSIHTPTKGVTWCSIVTAGWLRCFNPHTHEGCDCTTDKEIFLKAGFNPHTHEGCDLTFWIMLLQLSSFNPHTHEGCDLTFWIMLLQLSSFNPHTHEGCDLAIIRLLTYISRFNPHTHEGCDQHHPATPPSTIVSIHTPTKGVTAYSANGWISRCKDNDFAKDGKIITHKLL